MMGETGEADAFISGFSRRYADTIRPALQVVGVKEKFNHIAGMYILLTKKGPFFLADTTVNMNPSTQTLVDTTLLTAYEVKRFNIEPRIAMLSYSNFGAYKGQGSPIRVKEAVKILHEKYPELTVDGEIQANVALNQELMKENFSFADIYGKKVNTLIFPNLAAANIAYKLLGELTDFELIGPVLNGMNKPVHVLQMGSSVNEIVNMVLIAALDAQKS